MWTRKYSCGLVLLVIGSACVCHSTAAIPSLETSGAEAVVPGGLEQVQAAPEVPVLFQPINPFPPGYTSTAEPTASEALVAEESVVGPAVAEDVSQATVADAQAAAATVTVTATATGTVTTTTTATPTNAASFETTTAFNTFPWQAPVTRALLFTVNKITTAPAVPPAWAGRTLWPYTGAGGYLIAVEYASGPVGSYSELLYVTGKFYPPGCSSATAPRSSTLRNWVSSAAAADATRRIWGTPKQLATFAWSQKTSGTVTTLAVAITDSATNKVIFNVSTTTSVLPLPAQPSTVPAVHFPINDNAVRNVSGKVSAYAVGEQAFKQNKAISTTFTVPSTGGKTNTFSVPNTYVNTALLPFTASSLKGSFGAYGATILANTVTWKIAAPVLC